jgi:hypothetical protein
LCSDWNFVVMAKIRLLMSASHFSYRWLIALQVRDLLLCNLGQDSSADGVATSQPHGICAQSCVRHDWAMICQSVYCWIASSEKILTNPKGNVLLSLTNSSSFVRSL